MRGGGSNRFSVGFPQHESCPSDYKMQQKSLNCTSKSSTSKQKWTALSEIMIPSGVAVILRSHKMLNPKI